MFKLRRLKVLQYRNVKPGCELRFDDGINLVLGVNASGKTTLLALISAVCRSTFDGIKHEDFELEYEYASERFTIAAKVSHRRAPTTVEEQGLGGGPLWDNRYEVTLTEVTSGHTLSCVSGEGYHGRKIDLIMEWSFIAALLSGREQVWSEARSALFESFGAAFRFDESLECFAAMTGRRSALSGPESAPLARHEYSERRQRDGGVLVSGATFMPARLVAAFRREFLGGRAGHEASSGVELFTRGVAEHLDVAGVTMAPRITERRVTAGESFVLAEGFTLEITRPDGTAIDHDRLSYGQKRLLSFLYYLACNPAVVIADELVNGLHHRWIDACMKEVGSRQAFLTSQNPLLFDHAEFRSVEQVERRFVVCGLEMVDGREVMVWRNMSRSDAEVFFRAYEAGIEHVGDILITRGLW